MGEGGGKRGYGGGGMGEGVRGRGNGGVGKGPVFSSVDA
jgi:hypothetical protein